MSGDLATADATDKPEAVAWFVGRELSREWGGREGRVVTTRSDLPPEYIPRLKASSPNLKELLCGILQSRKDPSDQKTTCPTPTNRCRLPHNVCPTKIIPRTLTCIPTDQLLPLRFRVPQPAETVVRNMSASFSIFDLAHELLHFVGGEMYKLPASCFS
ncbi:hypothetical protein NL676_018918 [Syzygium grande]|nr:hypothetical protein NL676_018918 [Syzygium grande]